MGANSSSTIIPPGSPVSLLSPSISKLDSPPHMQVYAASPISSPVSSPVSSHVLSPVSSYVEEIFPLIASEIESNKKIAIIGTHQARMRCILAKYFSSLKGKTKKDRIERFANGAIVKLVLQINQGKEYGYVELLYSGDFKHTKTKGRKYYITKKKKEHDNPDRIEENNRSVLLNQLDKTNYVENAEDHKWYNDDVYDYNVSNVYNVIKNDKIKAKKRNKHDKKRGYTDNEVIVFDSIGKASKLLREYTNDNTYIFYFIRHGEGEHNVASRFKKMNLIDPELTEDGVESTKLINKALKNDVEKEKNGVDTEDVYILSSDLYRTRETLQYSIYGIDDIFKGMDKTIHVLPCSHELNYSNDGECDKKTIISGNENKSNCRILKYNEDNEQEDTYGCDAYIMVRDPEKQKKEKRNPKQGRSYDSETVKNIWKINWKQYNTFYNGTRRKASRKRRYCKKTNMVEQAIGLIEGRPHIGGRKKTKKKKK